MAKFEVEIGDSIMRKIMEPHYAHWEMEQFLQRELEAIIESKGVVDPIRNPQSEEDEVRVRRVNE